MQYHLNGFRAGNPNVHPKADGAAPRRDKVDVAIVGCGPAGLTLAAQLAQIGDLSVRIFERKTGPLEVGQADGVACRSMEMFEAFGFDEKLRKEAYWVNETAFWRPAGDGGQVHRAGRIQDVEDDLSHQPHVILNQARIHDFCLQTMQNAPSRLVPDYGRTLTDLTQTDDPDYPVTAVFACAEDPSATETIQAKYLIGCDGARSAVRGFMGLALKGEAARQLWGVMDVLAVTDFPDIRLKAAIQSADAGSMLIIPREGGYMVRLYIELDALHGDERASDRAVTPEFLAGKARAILAPYHFEVKQVVWWSAYEIGQRLCDRFDDLDPDDQAADTPRLFIAGDACHTHSPKAGQGMNVSMADAFNLGWKLAAVLKGQAHPALLSTYSQERQAKAQELIDFDRDMARLFSKKPTNADEEAEFQRYFQKHGRYTAGVETTYAPSLLIGQNSHQSRALGMIVGKRFHSAPVIRLADAKPMQLSQCMLADGRWRLIAFAGCSDIGQAAGAVAQLCAYWTTAASSPRALCSAPDADLDSVFDLRAVFQQPHRELDITQMPAGLLPQKGALGLTDYEKIFAAELRGDQDIFDMRGIDRETGALIVVRPDQYVAQVLPLDGTGALETFFAGFMQIPT